MINLDKNVSNILKEAVNKKELTPREAIIFPIELGCLAFNLFGSDEVTLDIELVSKWLRVCSEQKGMYQENSNETEGKELSAKSLVSHAVQFGFLIYENEAIHFKDNILQDYFCAIYCSQQFLDSFILANTRRHIWKIWAEVDPSLPDKLIQYLKDNQDNATRWDASDALYAIANQRVRNLLIEALEDSTSNIRSQAAEDLGRLNEVKALSQLIKALSDPDPKVRASSATALGEIADKQAVKPLISCLNDKNSDVRQEATYALGYIGDPLAVEPIIQLLKDPQIEDSAAIALGYLKDKRAVEPLIDALEDDSEELQFWAANALGKIGDKKAVDSLAKALSISDNERLVSVMAWALGKLGDSRAFEFLIKDLQSGSTTSNPQEVEKAWKAAEALGALKDKRAVPYLLAALNHNSFFLRINIAEALGKIKDHRSKEALIKLLQDKDNDVRASAVK
ncbi:MAG: lyase domain protein repeat-containing protein, partial [Chloroflexi bacterium]|nr:lyase domain protein repeat-containing protein [Chloroflexota bacterium]